MLARREVMAKLAADSEWPDGWAFDGRKNMYAATLFLPQHETQYEVERALRLAALMPGCSCVFTFGAHMQSRRGSQFISVLCSCISASALASLGGLCVSCASSAYSAAQLNHASRSKCGCECCLVILLGTMLS
jgi:hypothetical protein